ncbi:MAG TPA: DUF502 domain-containing protein [Gemmatimonadaceae bacterium]|nr:DUF502 domain-containing protein [Gemmatimonadaceae bacterium]
MRRLVSYFVRGLAFVAPIAITVYVCYRIFDAFASVDQLLGLRSFPGLGFLLTLAFITLVGFLGSTLLARGVLNAVDSAIERLPFVRLLYSSTKDLLNAFVGEKRRFDTPVLVPAPEGGMARAVGFVTQESLSRFGLTDHVAVYLPFSYSLSGRLYIYPASEIIRITATSAEAMAFVVSGGVTESARGA